MLITGSLFCMCCHKFDSNLQEVASISRADQRIKALEDIFQIKYAVLRTEKAKLCLSCSKNLKTFFEFFHMVNKNAAQFRSPSPKNLNTSNDESSNTHSVIDLDEIADDIINDNEALVNAEVESALQDVLQDYQAPGINLESQESTPSPTLVRIPSPTLVRIPTPPMIQIPSSSLMGFNKSLQLGDKVKIVTNPTTKKIQIIPSPSKTLAQVKPNSTTTTTYTFSKIDPRSERSMPKPQLTSPKTTSSTSSTQSDTLPVITDVRSLNEQIKDSPATVKATAVYSVYQKNNNIRTTVKSSPAIIRAKTAYKKDSSTGMPIKSKPVIRFDPRTGKPIIGSIITTKVNPRPKTTITRMTKTSTPPSSRSSTPQQSTTTTKTPASTSQAQSSITTTLSSTTGQSAQRAVQLMPSFKRVGKGIQAKCNVVYVNSKQPKPATSDSQPPAQKMRLIKTYSDVPANPGIVNSASRFKLFKVFNQPQKSTKEFSVSTPSGVKFIKFSSVTKSFKPVPAPSAQTASTQSKEVSSTTELTKQTDKLQSTSSIQSPVQKNTPGPKSSKVPLRQPGKLSKTPLQVESQLETTIKQEIKEEPLSENIPPKPAENRNIEPVKASGPKPVEGSIYKIVQASSSKPAEASSSKQAKTSSFKPAESSSSKPAEASSSKPAESSSSKPAEASSSKPAESSSSKPAEGSIYKIVQASSSKPAESSSSKLAESSSFKPAEVRSPFPAKTSNIKSAESTNTKRLEASNKRTATPNNRPEPTTVKRGRKRKRSSPIPVEIQIKIKRLTDKEISFYTSGDYTRFLLQQPTSSEQGSEKPKELVKETSKNESSVEPVPVKVENQKSRTTIKVRRFMCKICKALFSDQESVRIHVNNHQLGLI